MLKNNLLAAQERMKMQYGRNKTEREFQVGDWVYLILQPYRKQSKAHTSPLPTLPPIDVQCEILPKPSTNAHQKGEPLTFDRSSS